MSQTKIEWADTVWNPVTGCNKVSEGCRNCYAERMSKRLAGRCGYPTDNPFKVTLYPEKLAQPLKWKKPRRIFVNSMSDLFHDQVPDEIIARIWWVMGQCAGYLDPSRYRGHTFMILTKRPKRMKEWLDGWRNLETRKRWIKSFGEVFDWMSGPKYWPDVLPNVWLGVSVENQAAADERIPLLLQTQAAVKFVSCEPLLGPVNLERIEPKGKDAFIHSLSGTISVPFTVLDNRPKLDWVIVGGETGPGARPMHPDWVRSLGDQCQEEGVPFFFKSWGEWAPYDRGIVDSRKLEAPGSLDRPYIRIGKKKAGRILDGRTWEEFPEERR